MTSPSTTNNTAKKSKLISNSPVHYGWVVWLVATIGWIASSPGQSFTVSLFFDFFIDEFGLSRTVVSTLYSLGTFIASLMLTWLGTQVDRFGNRKVGVVVASLFALSLMLFSFVTGPISLLIAFIAIRGFGQGGMTLVNTTVIAEWFKNLRGRMMSFSLVGFSLFQAAYVPWLARQIQAYGWRQTWVILGVGVAALVVPLILILMRNKPEDYGLRPDGKGGRKPSANVVEKTADDDWGWTLKEAMTTPIFWAFVVGRVISPAWGTGLIIHQVSIFELVGHDATVAADTYALITLIAAGASLAFGWLVDKLRAGQVMAIQLTGLIGAMFISMFMTDQMTLVLYAMSFGLVIGGGGVFDGAVWANLFGRKYQGAIRGFVTTTLVAGTSLGPIIFGISYDVAGDYSPVLWLGITVSVISGIAAMLVNEPRKRKVD